MKFLKNVPKYFLQGLFYTIPIAITIYVVIQIFIILDGLLPTKTPGLGILIIIVTITFIGYIGSTILSSSMGSLFRYGERVLLRIPFIKIVYTAIKDLVGAFMDKQKTFNKPVLVKLSKESNIEKLGFITRESLSDLGIENAKVAVYLPHSYAFSGNMFIVETEHVTPLDASSAEVMKLIVSGGVASITPKSKRKKKAKEE